MPPASGIKAGKAFVEIHADNSRFVRGLKRAQAKLRAFGDQVGQIGRRVALLGVGATAGLVQAGRMFARTGSRLERLSQKTGVAVEDLSALQYAADQAGVDFEDMAGAIEESQIRIGEAVRRGSGPAAEALAELGLSAAELESLPLDKRLGLVADALNAVQSASQRQFLADEIFGGDAFKILPLLRQGADSIREATEEARRRGIVFDPETAARAVEFDKAMRGLAATVKRAVVAIGAALAPVLTTVSEQMGEIAGRVNKWLKANRGLVTLVLAATTATAAFGGALIALGVAAKVAAVGIGVLVGVLKALKIAMVLLTSPIGVVVAAVAGAIAIFAAFTDAGREATSKLAEYFRDLGQTFGTMLGGMGDALAAGDLELASKILFLGLKAAWYQGIAPLRTAWATFVGGLQMVFAEGMAAIKKAWTYTTSFIHRKLTEIEAARRGIVEVLAGEVAKAEVRVRGAFDDSIDVDASIRAIDDQVAMGIGRISRDKNAALEKINADKAEALGRIAGDLAEKLANITNETSGEIGRINEQIEAARAELAKLREDARQKAAVGDGGASGDGASGGGGAPERARLGGLRATGILRSRGVFNARAIQSLQDNPALLRQIKALEDIQRHTRRTADAVEEEGAVA